MKTAMQMKTGIVAALFAAGSFGMAASNASAAATVTFGETVPTTNILTSYESAAQTNNAWFNDGVANNGQRFVSQSFITPGTIGDLDYNVNKITMKMGQTLATDFPGPRPFSIDFYRIGGPGQQPIQVYLSSVGGTMQPTTGTATAGTYFTFALDSPLVVEAGKNYAYVMNFDAPDASQLIRMAISNGQPDPAGTRGWQDTNGGGWVSTGETYVNYIQGSQVPEPATIGLLAAGGAMMLLKRRTHR